MSDLLTRVRVVLTNLNTWLMGAVAVLGIFAEEIVKVLPDDWQGSVAQGIAVAVGVILAAVAFIRRVTPVVAEQRGLLPVEGVVVPVQNAPTA